MSLISTADLRTWIGIEDGDKGPNAKLDSLITAIEDFVDGFTNRKLEAARYNSDPQFTYLDGTGKPWIYLPQYPISYIHSVYVDADREWDSATLVASDDIFFYPASGKVVTEGEYFYGRQNVKIDYTAGYAPIVGGTHNSAVSTYPIPSDLKQVMVEMVINSFKEGITAIHTVAGGAEYGPKVMQMLSGNSFWRNVLNKYKAFDSSLSGRDE